MDLITFKKNQKVRQNKANLFNFKKEEFWGENMVGQTLRKNKTRKRIKLLNSFSSNQKADDHTYE